jgi:hypothetical protein
MISVLDRDREFFQPLMVSPSNHEPCIDTRSSFETLRMSGLSQLPIVRLPDHAQA